MPKKRQNNLISIGGMILFMWSIYACAGDLEDAKNAYGAGRFEEATNLLRPLVRQENIEAVYLQARMYEKGDGVNKDMKEARRLYSIAAAGGHESAQQKLDIFNVQSSDKSVVIDWYLPAAQEGDTEAQYNLGFMYETGWGVPENSTEAIRWYREASEMQHDVAQLRMAMMTIVGVGVSSSMRNGLELLHQSAENGNRIAEILVQDMFDVGDISEKDAKQVVSGIRRIFDDGEVETIKTLRRSLEALRRGTTESSDKLIADTKVQAKTETKKVTPVTTKPIDVVKAVTQKNLAAKKSVPVIKEPAHKEDQSLIDHESRKVAKGNLYKWYIEEAAKGEPDAQYHLGEMYIKGDQVEKDIEEGLHWMKLSAEQGHELAVIYTKLWEDDFDQNSFGSTIAIAWLKKSAREWNQQAVFTLGTLFETGRGVEKNFKQATQWYKFAAVNGHANAKRRLALIRKGGALLEQEGVSRKGETIVSSQSSLILLAIVTLVIGIVVFVYIRYFKPKRISAVPEQYQERVVLEKAKNSQGLQTDERKFFDELWSGAEPATEVAEKQENKPKIEDKPTTKKPVEEKSSTEGAIPVSKAVEEKPKSDDLSQVEERLAKAVEDLVSGGGAIIPAKTAGKKTAATNVLADDKKVASTPEPVQATERKSSIEKAMESAKPELQLEADNAVDHDEKVLGADSFINNSISMNELATSRVSADSLFADGVAIDEAGRAVGQGSYDPHKLDGDSVVFDEPSSISIKSVSAKSDDGQVKPRPIGPAASLLPKQSSVNEAEKESISLDSISEPAEKHDVDAPFTNEEERSLAEVHYNIGLMFSSGDGVPKNETQAAKWFLKAAEEGLPEGQFSLGQAYLNGNGVVMNTELALDWIQKAADNNYKPAQDMLKAQNKAI